MASFWLTGIYGPSKPTQRSHFWQELNDLSTLLQWSFENSNEGQITRSMHIFNHIIEQASLTDLPTHNFLFTWSNFLNALDLRIMYCFLVIGKVLVKFDGAVIKIFDIPTSNHYPILLSIGFDKWGSTLFTFENMCCNIRAYFHVWDIGGKTLPSSWSGHKKHSLLYLTLLWCSKPLTLM